MIQYNTMYYYTDIPWIPGEYSDCMTGNYDRVLSRIYMDWFLVKDQSNSLIYIWELTECNDFTDQSFYDQYIVTSGRNTHSLGPLTSTMPPPSSVFWSHFQFQDGKMLKQLIFYIFCWLFSICVHFLLIWMSIFLQSLFIFM